MSCKTSLPGKPMKPANPKAAMSNQSGGKSVYANAKGHKAKGGR